MRSVPKYFVTDNAKRVKFPEECVMCSEKYVFVVKNVYKSAELFKEGRNCIQDIDRPGRPRIVGTSEIVDSIYALLLSDGRFPLEDISERVEFFLWHSIQMCP